MDATLPQHDVAGARALLLVCVAIGVADDDARQDEHDRMIGPLLSGAVADGARADALVARWQRESSRAG